jgi:hypothetical protein
VRHYSKRTNLSVYHINSFDPDAVCGDGSPGAYYWAQAPNPDYGNVYLLYLGGHDWCYDGPSCETRMRETPEATSSRTWPFELALGGLFSPVVGKNPLAGANKAFLGYCSSDAWTGDAGPSPTAGGLQFRGQRIVKATLAALVHQHGLGSTYNRTGGAAQDYLLLAGGTAGGRGAMLLVDHLQGWLIDLGILPDAVAIRGLFDSALWVPLTPLGAASAATSLASQVQTSIALFNATNLAAPACLATHTVATIQWQCLFPATALTFVQTPYLLVQPQFDKRQLKFDLRGATPPFAVGSQQALFATQFATAIKTASQAAVQSPNNALFSAACYKAATTLTPQMYVVRAQAVSPVLPGNGSSTDMAQGLAAASVAPVTLAHVLNAWFFGGQGPSASAEDSCSGFACGPTCRKSPGHSRTPGVPRNSRTASSDAVIGGVSRASSRSSNKSSAAHQRSATFGLVALVFGIPAVCAYALQAIIPRGGPAGERARGMAMLSEGTPLRPVLPTAVRTKLQRWAEEDSQAKWEATHSSKSQVLTRFYSGFGDEARVE